MSIDDGKKRENESVQNSLMKKVKIKNKFEEEQKKIKKNKFKETYALRIKKKMGEYYEKKQFKSHAKRKKDNYSKILNVIKKTMKTLKEKNQRKHKQ